MLFEICCLSEFNREVFVKVNKNRKPFPALPSWSSIALLPELQKMEKDKMNVEEIPRKLKKETELPADVDYRGVGGEASINRQDDGSSEPKEKQDNLKKAE